MFRQETPSSSAFDTFRPFVDRALRDDEIRRNVFRAFNAARKVYEELGGEGPIGAASKLSGSGSGSDRVRDDLDTTVRSLSEAIVRLSGNQPRQRQSAWGVIAIVAVLLVILFNPATGTSTRRWLKDNLFGSEEEFDYSTPRY